MSGDTITQPITRTTTTEPGTPTTSSGAPAAAGATGRTLTWAVPPANWA